MDELRGDRARWQFDGRSIYVQFPAGRSQDPVLAALGSCQVPVAAVAAVDFRPGEKRQGWTLRLRLRERTDPYAAVGVALAERSDPFRLAGPAKTRLVAEYWANEIASAAEHAAGDLADPAAVALGFVPPVPVHIRTAEGTAAFDGGEIRLVWAGSSASRRKRQEQRRAYSLSDLVGVEWVPSDGWEWGHLRLLTQDPAAEPVRLKDDLASLRCNDGAEGADALLLAATITAHLWAGAAPAPDRPGSQVIYERIRELGRLHEEGILTDSEFATKKAELLDRL